MYQRTTQIEPAGYCDVVKKKEVSDWLNPEKETLAFLMHFARVYHVEKQLPHSLSGMVLN